MYLSSDRIKIKQLFDRVWRWVYQFLRINIITSVKLEFPDWIHVNIFGCIFAQLSWFHLFAEVLKNFGSNFYCINFQKVIVQSVETFNMLFFSNKMLYCFFNALELLFEIEILEDTIRTVGSEHKKFVDAAKIIVKSLHLPHEKNDRIQKRPSHFGFLRILK